MRRVLIVLLVVAGLLVGADFGAAALAESAVARQMREQVGLVDDPSVRINGFPFLTQAISGHYGSVDVDAQHITVGKLTDVDVTVQLRDVDAPLSMLLGSGQKTLQVGEAEGTVAISAKDLQKLTPGIDDLRVDTLDAQALKDAVADGSDPSVAELDPEKSARLVGTVSLLGIKTEVSVIASLELVDGIAKIVPRDVQVGGTKLPLSGTDERKLLKQFALDVNPGTLPFKVDPTGLKAVDNTLEVSGTAENLTLGGSQPVTAG